MTLGTSLLLLALGILAATAILGAGDAMFAPAADGGRANSPVSVPGSRSPARRLVAAGMLAALAVLVVAILVRAVMAGRAPWANLHEVSQATACFLVASYVVLARRQPVPRLAPLVAGLAAALVVVALLLPDDVIPLAPALQAPLLLTVHVGAAITAYAVAGLAFVAAVAELVQVAMHDRLAALPSAATARRIAHRAVLVAFPILTAAIVLGSVWANLAWRSYWNNDPKELAAAGTWLVYAAYLHVAGRRDRPGKLGAWLLVLGFGGVLFTYLGASLLFPGQHSYAGV
jgi:cytochrome c-type biogenesis protein CcsB